MKYLGNALIVIQFLNPKLEQVCECETELHIQYGVIVDWWSGLASLWAGVWRHQRWLAHQRSIFCTRVKCEVKHSVMWMGHS